MEDSKKPAVADAGLDYAAAAPGEAECVAAAPGDIPGDASGGLDCAGVAPSKESKKASEA